MDPLSKICIICQSLFYAKPNTVRKRNCCSRKCQNVYFKKTRIPNKKCLECGIDFWAYDSANRRRMFCSYSCHLKNGGAFRAGIAGSKMRKKYGAKKDANHNEIINVLLKMGIPFYDLSACGHGVPDGIAWVKESWQFLEIKNPKTRYGRRGLNPIQKKWIGQWNGGGVFIINSIDDAVLFAQGKFENLDCIKGCYAGEQMLQKRSDTV